MNSKKTESVTADQAVARIVNVDYIPEGFTLLEMTAAFLEEAENDYENAIANHVTETQRSLLANRANICETRHKLAIQLFDSIQLELISEDSMIAQVNNNKLKEPLFDMLSVSDWAFYQFGIGTPSGFNFGRIQIAYTWEDITIKIYADYKLGVKIKNGKYQRSSFQSIGLMGKRKKNPNHLGKILIGLSQRQKFPQCKCARAAHKTAMSKLRHSLVKLINLSSDPFTPFNEGDGWLPRFELIYDCHNADERAKNEARLVSLDENRDNYDSEAPNFERQNDEIQRWIDRERGQDIYQ